MGVSLGQYRAAIGSFAGGRSRKENPPEPPDIVGAEMLMCEECLKRLKFFN